MTDCVDAEVNPTVSELEKLLAKRRMGTTSEIQVERRSIKRESEPAITRRPLATTSAADKENATIGANSQSTGNPTSPVIIDRSVATDHSSIDSTVNAIQGSSDSLSPLTERPARDSNVPRLLDTDRASKNDDTQREIEALRQMRGLKGVALTRTRMIGVESVENASEEDKLQKMTLKTIFILQRHRQHQ